MKKSLVFVLCMFCAIANAQTYMNVNIKGGNVVRILTDSIDNITWVQVKHEDKDNHEYVDLGLPSGTLWATCNIGASSPEEYGYYLAWGESAPQSVGNPYNWNTYKLSDGQSTSMTKYCTNSTYGTVDKLMTLESADDAAYVLWGAKWRIPTVTEIEELMANCTWTWETLNGHCGFRVASSKDASRYIFLPVGGRYIDYTVSNPDTGGYYWSSSLYVDKPYGAWCLIMSGENYQASKFVARYEGLAVRPVRSR